MMYTEGVWFIFTVYLLWYNNIYSNNVLKHFSQRVTTKQWLKFRRWRFGTWISVWGKSRGILGNLYTAIVTSYKGHSAGTHSLCSFRSVFERDNMWIWMVLSVIFYVYRTCHTDNALQFQLIYVGFRCQRQVCQTVYRSQHISRQMWPQNCQPKPLGNRFLLSEIGVSLYDFNINIVRVTL